MSPYKTVVILQSASHKRKKKEEHRKNDRYQKNRYIGDQRCSCTPPCPSDCCRKISSQGSGKKQKPDPLPLGKGLTATFKATSNQIDTIEAEEDQSGRGGASAT